MKNYFTLLLLLLGISEAYPNTFYTQLCEFNSNWEKYEHLAPKGDAQCFDSDAAYVQAHLKNVLTILRNNTLHKCSLAQIDARLNLIKILENYYLEGVFPTNYNCENRIPVFIDEDNTHCAVGYLLKETGYGKLAKEIAETNNYAWIKEIDNLSFLEWQKSSGFSLEELKLIQGAYEFYLPNALSLPNKYEVPQRPECMLLYFEDESKEGSKNQEKENIWVYGEGENGILNGVWEQNFAKGIPWIKGYFKNGKRTGQWKEYYQGTNQLCRTENWRDDKLNGIRKRFDRSGNLIEEILFKNGAVVSKINYDRNNYLVWVRKPLKADLLWTEVYNLGGAIIGEGHEKVYNPGNLLWFQDIELTALNSAAITTKSALRFPIHQSGLLNPHPFNQQPPLVEYKKEGKWTYYKDVPPNHNIAKPASNINEMLHRSYAYFGKALYESIKVFGELNLKSDYDSIHVVYKENVLQHFYGFGEMDYTHLFVDYYQLPRLISSRSNSSGYSSNVRVEMESIIKEFGQYDSAHHKIGKWRYFDEFGRLYKIEDFILPWKEEEDIGSL